jgi:hypothetical protein
VLSAAPVAQSPGDQDCSRTAAAVRRELHGGLSAADRERLAGLEYVGLCTRSSCDRKRAGRDNTRKKS